MKFSDALRGYAPLTKEQEDEAWSNGLFCLDSNVLLDVYRYSDTGRKEFLAVLNAIKSRLFIPARVADEFARNRPNVIRSKFAPHRFVRQKLKEIRDGLHKNYKDYSELQAVETFVENLQKLEVESFKDAEALKTPFSARTEYSSAYLPSLVMKLVRPVPMRI